MTTDDTTGTTTTADDVPHHLEMLLTKMSPLAFVILCMRVRPPAEHRGQLAALLDRERQHCADEAARADARADELEALAAAARAQGRGEGQS